MKRDLLGNATAWLDARTARGSRTLARKTSRRGVITRLGKLLVGAAALPLLPVARELSAQQKDELGDPQACDYWRYCALGGTLCACCGGTASQCPPGTELSPISWIGTCRNPVDGRDYLISYNDCCGKSWCQRCRCHNTERERPIYAQGKANGVLWCFGTQSRAYHCTVAGVLGEAGKVG
jgi:methylamine dehydrogenase light chain